MKIQSQFIRSVLAATAVLGASVASSQAAITFTIGAQAVANPGGGNFPNVWPSSGNENPANAIDGNLANKYLNFAKNDTGYIYTLPGQTTATVTGINFVSGGDAPLRDPTTYLLYGSNTAVASTVPGTIFDVTADFTLISSGDVSLPDGPRGGADRTTFNTTFAGTVDYNTFLLVFPTVKGSADPAVNSMQIGEARLQTATGGLDNSGVIGGGQMVIPEPGSAALLAVLGLGLLARRRRSV